MRVDYLGLEAFVAVAELGSVSRAAERLNLSQTALSHRLRKVEAELGTRLLTRTSREVTLTKAGQILLPQVREQLMALSSLYGAMRQESSLAQRRITFACLPTVSQYYLPPILALFARDRPGIGLTLIDQPAGRIPTLVHDGEAEFGITILGAGAWDLESEHLYSEPYVLLVPPGHRLAERASVTRADLIGEPMVRIRTQSTNRQLIEDSLGDVARHLDWRIEVQSASTAMHLVAEGAGITFLPRLTADLATRNTVIGLPFSDVTLTRDIGVLHRRGVPLAPATSVLLDMIRARLVAL